MNRYILQGHKAVLVDKETYLNQPEHQNRIVATSTIENYFVSTVFLGVDHQWEDDGPPLLFETMVFGKGPLNERLERCTTWEEAEVMHEKMCEEIRQQENKPGEQHAY